MKCRSAWIAVLLAALAGCSREQGPDLPPIDQAQYQQEHQAWRGEQRVDAGLKRLPSAQGYTPASQSY